VFVGVWVWVDVIVFVGVSVGVKVFVEVFVGVGVGQYPWVENIATLNHPPIGNTGFVDASKKSSTSPVPGNPQVQIHSIPFVDQTYVVPIFVGISQ
jgi:hypothetical protein